MAESITEALSAEIRVIDQPEEKPKWIDPWPIFSLQDAFKERPEASYILDRIFKMPSLNILYGPPGTLKTLLLADLAICVAAGIDWLEPLPGRNDAKPIKVIQSPVFWLDMDCGRDGTHEHFEAVARARNLEGQNIPFHYFSMPDEGFNIANKRHLGEMILRCQDLGAKMICIDNLGNISGNADENSNQMQFIMAALRRLSEDTGAATQPIHHQRKGDEKFGRKGDKLRGHSSIEAAIDLALIIKREEYSPKITLESTKSRRMQIEPFSAMFTYEQKQNGDLYKARFFGLGIDQDTATIAIENEILDILQDGPINKTNLAAKVSDSLPKVGQNRVRDVIEVLALRGKIKIDPGYKGSKLCSL